MNGTLRIASATPPDNVIRWHPFFFFGCFETAAMEHSTIFPAVPPMKPFVMFLALDVQQGCYVDVMDVIIFSFLCFCLLSSLVGQLIHFDSFFFSVGSLCNSKGLRFRQNF